MTEPILIHCSKPDCLKRLGHVSNKGFHLDIDIVEPPINIKMLLRPDGQLTVACPACGTLILIGPHSWIAMIEKGGGKCELPFGP